MIVREDTYCVLRTEKQSIPGIYKELTLPLNISLNNLGNRSTPVMCFVKIVQTVDVRSH